MKFNETFKNYPKKDQQYHKKVVKSLIGKKIVDLEYGPDVEGDPQIYKILLDGNSKIGIAKVYLEPDNQKNAVVEEEDRKKYYIDKKGKYILRFQFFNLKLE